MAEGESAENVGGIEISVGVDDEAVDADLDALFARLQEKAQQAQISIPVGLQQTSAAVGPPGRQPRQPQPQSAVVGFGPGGRSGRQSFEDLPENLQRQIAAVMPQVPEQQVSVAVTPPVRQRTDAAREELAEATKSEPTQVQVVLDTSEFRVQFDAFLTELRAISGQASQALRVTPQVVEPGIPENAAEPPSAPVRRARTRAQEATAVPTQAPTTAEVVASAPTPAPVPEPVVVPAVPPPPPPPPARVRAAPVVPQAPVAPAPTPVAAAPQAPIAVPVAPIAVPVVPPPVVEAAQIPVAPIESPQVSPTLDATVLQRGLDAALGDVQTWATQASEAAVVRPTVERPVLPQAPELAQTVRQVVEPATVPAPQATTIPVDIESTPAVEASARPAPVTIPVGVAPTPAVQAPQVRGTTIPVAAAAIPAIEAPAVPTITPQVGTAAAQTQFSEFVTGLQQQAEQAQIVIRPQVETPAAPAPAQPTAAVPVRAAPQAPQTVVAPREEVERPQAPLTVTEPIAVVGQPIPVGRPVAPPPIAPAAVVPAAPAAARPAQAITRPPVAAAVPTTVTAPAQQPLVVSFDPEALAEQERMAESESRALRDVLGAQRPTAELRQTPAERELLRTITPQLAPRQEQAQLPRAALVTPEMPRREAQEPTPVALSRDDRRLIELSYQAQAQQQQEIGTTGFAPPRTSRQRAEFVESEARRADELRARQATVPPQQRVQTIVSPQTATSEPYLLPEEREPTRGGRRIQAPLPGRSDEDIQRRAQARAAVAEATAVTAARTARSQAAGLGGFFGGVSRERIAATSDLTAKEQELTLAQRRLNVEEAKGPQNNRAIRAAREELTVAQGNYAKSLERVEKLSGATGGLRNLAAVTAAGAAFGIGLKALDTGLALVSKAFEPAFERMLGFAPVTARVTDALSDQTKQAYGNVQAVVAMAQAQAGLSAAAAKVTAPLLTEQAAIEAGNKNLAEAVDQFETYQRLRQQGVKGIEKETGGILGLGLFGTRSAEQELGRLFQALPTPQQRGEQRRFREREPIPAAEAARNLSIFTEGLGYANEQVSKGGEKFLKFVSAATDEDLRRRTVAAAELSGAPAEFINALRDGQIGVQGLSTDAAEAARQLHQLAEAANKGTRQTDAALLREQFNRQNPALIAGAARQLQFATQAQLPAQAFLQRVAQPILPAGTGIAPANAEEAAKAATSNRETAGIQQQITAYQEQGRRAVVETYRPAIVRDFGQAAVQVFDRTLASIEATGKQIASISASLSNEQAAYQVAQYNYQLQIAKRSLSDIGGLTGRNFGEGQSYLGILERQNLALSRQGQLLSFELSQRQINFQTAVAGFEAPGVTPAERQARIKEAQIEADFAQRQLNIQKTIFGNQVQIVDISNLRQGVDLAGQIGLLVQGRKVTFDTATAQQQLAALNTQQADLVNQVGVYFGTINSLTATGIGQIQQLEATAGRAMTNIAVAVLSQFGIFIHGLNDYVGAIGQGGRGGGRNQPINFQTGELFSTSRPTNITVGEAGNETVAVLRNPRQYLGTVGGGSSGGDTIIIDVHDNQVRSDADFESLARRIEQSLGRQASLRGLRVGG